MPQLEFTASSVLATFPSAELEDKGISLGFVFLWSTISIEPRSNFVVHM